MADDKSVTPATKEFWEIFYDEGIGKNLYEWYVDFDQVNTFIKKNLKEGDKILHVGCGNSLLAERVLSDCDYPEQLKIINVDICENVIERMKTRLEETLKDMEDLQKHAEKKRVFYGYFSEILRRDPFFGSGSESGSVLIFFSRSKSGPIKRNFKERIFTRDQISYHVMDVCHMNEFEDNTFDVVLDKGMLDALLSHGRNETGDDEFVIALQREIFRVLKPGGKWLIVSGNDQFITWPYICGDENVTWDANYTSFRIENKTRQQQQQYHTYFLYNLVAEKDPIE